MKNTEIYRGIEIQIDNDFSADNPFEAWDCNLPLMNNSGRGNFQDYSKGDINEYLSEILTDGQIIRHQNKIAAAFEIDLEELERDYKIDEVRYEIRRSEDFEALEVICTLSKTPFLNTNSRGYSQGDYADIFICYTSNFEETTGCKISQIDEKFLQSTADLFGSWAWGDTYSFMIEDIEDGDHIGSCAGFYGNNHDESGLLEEARADIDRYLEEKRENRFSKIKELIKSKVSFIYRPQILASL